MYNRYIPNGASYTRVVEEDAPPTQTVPPDAPPPEPDAEAPESAKPASGLGKLLRGLKLDGLDTGDVLLLLILLFLFLELSLIHISEPTRLRLISVCGVRI